MSIVVIRNGGAKLRFPQVEEKTDGTLWFGGNPILGIDDENEKKRICELLKTQKYDQIPQEYFVRFGANENGLWVGTDQEWAEHPDRIKQVQEYELQRHLEKVKDANHATIFLSSRGWGDYSNVEWRGDISQPENEILAQCRHLLETGIDVDLREQTDDEILQRIHTAKEEAHGKTKEDQERLQKFQQREERKKSATMDTALETITDEGGETKIAHHTVTLPNGSQFRFADRNVFDFGRVINPDYEIAPGIRGGLRNGDVWETFISGEKHLPEIKYQENGLPEGWTVIENPQFTGYKSLIAFFFGEKSGGEEMPDPDPDDCGGISNPKSHRYNVLDAQGQFAAGHATPAAAIKHALKKVGYTADTAYIVDQEMGWTAVRPLTLDEKVAFDYVVEFGYYSRSSIRMCSEAQESFEEPDDGDYGPRM